MEDNIASGLSIVSKTQFVMGDHMKVGMAVVMQSLDERPDDAIYAEELALADLAEPLGFDSLWATEHHFSDYMVVPDALQFLTFMAARTSRVKLGTAVLVLPWHDPVRLAEQVLMLDTLSGGRSIIGLGRGSGKLEFQGLRVPMDESRERFAESAEVLQQALSGKPFNHRGRFFDIPEITVRPRPSHSFEGRLFGAAVSPGSAEIVARMGLGMFIIPQRPWEESATDARMYADVRRSLALPPLPPIALCWVCIGVTDRQGEDDARRYMGAYWHSADRHYGLTAGQHAGVKGYEFFQHVSGIVRESSPADQVENYLRYHVVGSPRTCVEKIRFIQQQVANDHFVAVFRYGGMSADVGERNARLFADEVLPELRRM